MDKQVKIKRIPYGTGDFEAISANNEYYVDKTMYIPNIENNRFVFLIPWIRWLHCTNINGRPVKHCATFRFHFNPHTACSLHYNLDRYESDTEINTLNSQACEQLNAILVV